MKKVILFSALCLFFVTFSTFAGVELSGTYDWNRNVKKVCRGIVYTQIELKEPRLMKIAVVRVDLKAAKFSFKITSRDPDWGKPMPDFPGGIINTRRITCRKFMEDAVKNGENMVVSVNGSPWSPFRPPWTHKYAGNQGLMISNGVLVAPVRGKRPSFVVYKDGRVGFNIFKKDDDLSNVLHAISGFGVVLQNDTVRGKDSPKAKLAPRTGYGLSKDHRYLYLMAVDGRQPLYSMGCSTYEVGQLLKYFGAYEGLNMDGGGSTTLIVRKGKKLRKLNSHAGGYERAVGGAMGIIFHKR